MKTYTYELVNEPTLWKTRTVDDIEEDYGIQPDVLNSDMDDKSIIDCTWDGETKVLTINFENTLSSADKTKLDTIVEANS